VAYRWVDCDRGLVRQRYDRIARYIPLIDCMLFLPRDLRRKAAASLGLACGDSVLEIGCGTGRSFPYLRDAVGPNGRIYGVDISPGMLRRARDLRDAKGWHNIELSECDAAEYVAPTPLDGVLFSLSYNTMPHHKVVLRQAWQQLRPGGHLVIMDAKVPPGLGGKIVLPVSLWLMKHTMLGNPLIHPWKELAAITAHFDMSEYLFSSYYICRGMKPLLGSAAVANDEDGSERIAHSIAAE